MKPTSKPATTRSRDVVWLRPDEILYHPDVPNVRGGNEGEALGDLEELQASIRIYKIRQPVEVIRIDGSLYLADGFRRLAVVRSLMAEDSSFDLIPAFVSDGTVADLKIANLTGNMGRQEVSAYAFAHRIWELHTDSGMITSEIAARTGKTQRTVQLAIKSVGESHPTIRSAALRGEISFDVVRVLFLHPHETQLELLAIAKDAAAKAEEQGRSPQRVMKAAIREHLARTTEKAKSPEPVPEPPRTTIAPATTHESKPEACATPPTAEAQPTKKPDQIQDKDLIAIRKRLDALRDWSTAVQSDDTDIVRLLESLQLDLTNLNVDGAGVYATIDGIVLAIAYIAGDACTTCGKPAVKICSTKLPQMCCV